MSGIGLALGGGGARGAFQIGVWRAFRELGIEFEAIAGTSVGAINAALMIGTEYERAAHMWRNLKMEQCLAFSPDQDLKSADLFSLKNANIVVRELLAKGGLNTQPLRTLLNHYISEQSIRGSATRFGLMTALLPTLTPQPFWIDQIPAGELIEYVIASARYPGLEPVKIADRRFIDGGVAENVPVSLLRRKGIRKIIAVDLRPNPSLRWPIDDNIQLTFIHDKQDLGGTMDLNPVLLNRGMELGYLDAMKAMDRLNGLYYTFTQSDYSDLMRRFGSENLYGLEQAALAYDIDRCAVYTAEAFIDLIRRRRNEVYGIYLKERQALQIENKLQAVLNGQMKILRLLPPMKLAFLLELTAMAQQNGYALRLPAQMFSSLTSAAAALSAIPEDYESHSIESKS